MLIHIYFGDEIIMTKSFLLTESIDEKLLHSQMRRTFLITQIILRNERHKNKNHAPVEAL